MKNTRRLNQGLELQKRERDSILKSILEEWYNVCLKYLFIKVIFSYFRGKV